MNLFYELFYKKWVEGAFYSVPLIHFLFFIDKLNSFPTIKFITGYPITSRKTKKIQLIILHSTGSDDISKALTWMFNPNNYNSMHYIVSREGDIIQLVDESNAALHVNSGKFNNSRLVNASSIGVSIVGSSAYTESQYESLALLCKYLKDKYQLNDSNIVSHASVLQTLSTTNCLLGFDFNKLGNSLKLCENM